MKLNKKFLLCVLFCFTLLTACNPMSKEQEVEDGWESTLTKLKTASPKEVDSHINVQVSDNFSVDADIVISDELDSYQVTNLKMKRHLFEDLDKTLQDLVTFCNFKTVGEVKSRTVEDFLEDGRMMDMRSIDGEKEMDFIQVRSAYLSVYFDKLDKSRLWPSPFDETGWRGYHYIEEFKILKDLDFISVEDVKKQTDKIGELLDISFDCESEVYTYTVERVQKVAEEELAYYQELGMEKDMDNWNMTKEEELYVVVMHQGYQGIPLSIHGGSYAMTNAVWSVNNECSFSYSKDGMGDIHIYNVFDIEDIGEVVDIVSVGDILEKHYANNGGRKQTVVKVQLYYLPIYTGVDLEFTTKPIWYILGDVDGDVQGTIARKAFVYDAVTGEELAW